MCGIAGLTGRFPDRVITEMGARLAQRGPDGEGIYRDPSGDCALAHRRLAIIDLSPAGRQPMTDAGDRYTITYNGEIYNYRALRESLMATGATFRGHSDTEVLLELFARDGIGSFAQLNGIFAFAIWDRRERALWLVRDGMGVKPLYVATTGAGVAFASELKALLSVPGLDRTIDRVAAAAYVGYLYSPGERTMFTGVRKLDPGTWLKIDTAGKRMSGRFYTLPCPGDPIGDPAAAISATEATLRQAVERQMVADVEVGAFLSGGLDSSAIVAFARDVAPRRMQCFTIAYRSTADEERELIADLPYARRAAAHLGVELHEVEVDARMADSFESLVYTLDEPQADPAAINNLEISAAARRHGLKVLLGGAGGDDLFTGYRRHSAAPALRHLARLPAPAGRLIAGASRALPARLTATRRLRKFLSTAGLPAGQRVVGLFEWLDLDRVAALVGDGDGDGLAAAARAPMIEAIEECAEADLVSQVLRIDQRFFLTDHNLNYTDKTGMAAGVEIRVPFLDPDLVSLAARIPMAMKLRDGQTKWVLRKAMEPHLPHDVIYRPKTGFGVPLRSWMRGELRPLINDLLSPDTIRRRGLFDEPAVAALRRASDAGRIDGSYPLLALATVELWCRRFVDAS